MIIKSKENPTYKLLNKLRSKKYRDKENSYIIESKKLVDEAISSSADIDFIFLREDVSYNKDIKTQTFEKNLFEKLTLLKNSDGIAAKLFKNKEKPVKSDKILLLDNLNDPGNLGTIIRSAEAFGFTDIILYGNCCDIYNEKTLRASMGSIFRINITSKNLDQIKELKKTYKILSADMAGSDIKSYNDYEEKIILAIGNEANGLSQEIRDLTDIFLKISMKGLIESLNAAIAASIMMNMLS